MDDEHEMEIGKQVVQWMNFQMAGIMVMIAELMVMMMMAELTVMMAELMVMVAAIVTKMELQ